MQADRWEIGPVLTRSWELFKDNLGVILGATIIAALINGLFSGINQGLQSYAAGADSGLLASTIGIVVLTVGLVGWVVQTYISLGFIRLFLKAARNEGPQIADLFSGGRYLVPGIIASLLVALGVSLGFLLLVVPGVILSLGWMFTQLLLVDKNLGPVDAIKESWRITQGEKGGLFLWALVVLGVLLVGVMACGIGLFVAAPVVGLGTTLIYLDLERRSGSELI
jgi:hypothetical protein